MVLMQAKEYLRNRVEVAIDQARRVVDAREMASMPRYKLANGQYDMQIPVGDRTEEVHCHQ